LIVLGPDFAFRTEFLLAGDTLVVEGSGDPALGDPALLAISDPPLSPDDLLGAIVDAIVEAGVTGVDEVVIDDRIFDDHLVHDAWPRDQLDRHYCAPVCGFNFHRNVLSFYLTPASSPPDPPAFTIEPEMPWVARETVNRAKTVADGHNQVGVLRNATENRFTIIGQLRTRTDEPDRKAIHNPRGLWGDLLVRRLQSAEVKVGNETPRRAEAGERFDDARPLVVVSTPLRDIVRLCNVDSINLYAEALLKRMGHDVANAPGSWENGSAVVRMVLGEHLGPTDAAGTVIEDGSGMSRGNRVSPRTLTRWLRVLWQDPALRDVFVTSLPTRGEGTLESRFRTTPLTHEIRAKSGFINHVYSLSGYLLDGGDGGDRGDGGIAFSVILNDVPLGQGWKAKRLHERIVQAADQWLTESSRNLADAQGG